MTEMQSSSGKKEKAQPEALTAKALRAVDLAALVLLGIYTVWGALGLTTFYIPIPGQFQWMMLIAVQLLTGVKMLLMLRRKELWLCLPFAMVFYLAWPSGHYFYSAFCAYFLILCIGVPAKKVLRVICISSVTVLTVMIVSSLCGGMPTLVAAGRNIRTYLGSCSPTDMATWVLFAAVFAWSAFEEIPDAVFLAVALIPLFIAGALARSNTVMVCGLLFAALVLYKIIEDRRMGGSAKGASLKRVVNGAVLLSFPAIALVMNALVYAYHKELPFSRTLDTILHKRLVYAARMYGLYGLKPFGTFFDMIGNGFSTIGRLDYTFIDSSYPMILIRHGYVTMLALCVLWGMIAYRAAKAGNRRLLLAMLLIAVNCIEEHHYTELYYNPLLVLPFADFRMSPAGQRLPVPVRGEAGARERRMLHLVVSLLFFALCLFLFPEAASWARTVFNGYGLSGGGWNGGIVFAAVLLSLITVAVGSWSAGALAADAFCEKRRRSAHLLPLLGGGALALAAALYCSHMIDRLGEQNAARLAAAKELLEMIRDHKSGKLYADRLPEVFDRYTGGINVSYLGGEDWARSDNATVIVDASFDSDVFAKRGFLYMPLSDLDAVYTNDREVIAAFRAQGLYPTGYNTHIFEVDLAQEADLNGLSRTEDGALRLEGAEKSLIYGPYRDLFAGKYTAVYRLRIDPEAFEENEKICTLRIHSYWGERVPAEAVITKRLFDEEGTLEYALPFGGGGLAYEFLAFMEEGREMTVEGIACSRTPAYDTHIRCDDRGRVIHEEYYDLSGKPYAGTWGYYGTEYAYDDADNRLLTRFLGEDLKPFTISAGYAEVHREYDVNRQMIRESYYDEKGEKTALAAGYAAKERTYDFAGNVTGECYFGVNDERVLRDDAYWKVEKAYDENNRMIREAFYDTEEKPAMQKTGYCFGERKYDDAGNVTEYAYFDEAGKPVISTYGYAILRRTYDENNRIIREDSFGKVGLPIMLEQGYASEERAYDAVGNVIVNRYFGTDGSLVMRKGGYAIRRQEYDDRKRVIRRGWFDTDDTPVVFGQGYSVCYYQYDDAGNTVCDRYCDANGDPVVTTWGYTEWHRVYNDKKLVVRETYHDADGTPVMNATGYAEIRRVFNEDNRVIRESYHDLSGAPVMNTSGFAVREREYDENGEVTQERRYDTEGRLVS